MLVSIEATPDKKKKKRKHSTSESEETAEPSSQVVKSDQDGEKVGGKKRRVADVEDDSGVEVMEEDSDSDVEVKVSINQVQGHIWQAIVNHMANKFFDVQSGYG